MTDDARRCCDNPRPWPQGAGRNFGQRVCLNCDDPDPGEPMTTPADLRNLDEAIALARGWTRDGGGWWWWTFDTPIPERAHGATWSLGETPAPPPYSSSWALAGPLLEEMAESGRSEGDETGVVFVGWPMRWCAAPSGIGMATTDSDYSPGDEVVYAHDGGGPCEAIARAWLSWHRSKI